jgi:hypothetical protein
MKKAIFLLFCLCMTKCRALTLLNEEGQICKPFLELLKLCDIPTDGPLLATALLAKHAWIQEGKERWEYEERFSDKKEEATALLEQIGCFKAVYAKHKQYDYALVLGALMSRVEARLDFLWEQWQKGVRFSTLIFLTGERDITPALESLPPGIESETEMMMHLYQHHPLKAAAPDLPLLVVHTPKQKRGGTLMRPNTEDTVRAWLKMRPQPGSCLAVSDQPFVGYQEAVLKVALPSTFRLEVIGPADPGKYPLILYLDNLAKWLGYELLSVHSR